VLPELNRQFQVIPDIVTSEKRTLAPRPVFEIRNIGKFINKFNLFYNDHFGFRAQFVTANTLIHVRLFGILGVQNVIMGKYGWLFFNAYGPGDPKECSGWQEQGYYPYSLNQLIAIQKHLEAENEWFIKRNITFFVMPAPDKRSIYREYLPSQFNAVVGPSRLTQFFEHMKLHSKLQPIDIQQALLSAKKLYSLDIYFKTDSHWNNIGAFVAYQEVMKRLLIVYPQLRLHRFEDFIQDKNLKRRGDLAIMANLDVSHILEHQLVPKQNATYSNNGPKKGKLLIFGDSFTKHFFMDYFRRHFNDVESNRMHRSATSKLNKDIVSKYRPDVVIFESIEGIWASTSG